MTRQRQEGPSSRTHLLMFKMCFCCCCCLIVYLLVFNSNQTKISILYHFLNLLALFFAFFFCVSFHCCVVCTLYNKFSSFCCFRFKYSIAKSCSCSFCCCCCHSSLYLYSRKKKKKKSIFAVSQGSCCVCVCVCVFRL